MSDSLAKPAKEMRLRYGGRCRQCNLELAAGTVAVYDPAIKNVTCMGCAAKSTERPRGKADSTAPELSTAAVNIAPHSESEQQATFSGVAGASAQREFARRSEKREARIRTAHPKLGGLMLALSEDPQSTKAWAVGARGEEKLGRVLDGLTGEQVHVLHDRRIPRTKANIDHIVVCPSGVFAIDAKRYKDQRPTLRVEGGILRERTEQLMVGSRDCTKLVGGVQWQVDGVLDALEKAELHDVPVTGVLCFVEADWPIFGSDFEHSGIKVLWPKKAAELIRKPGPINAATSQHIFRTLAELFPEA